MKLVQANVRSMLPEHKLVFNEHTIEIYWKHTDKKAPLQMVASILMQKAGAVVRLLLPNGRWNTFAKVTTFPGTFAIRRELIDERVLSGNKRAVTEKQVAAAFAKANSEDVICCLHILAGHFSTGVHPAYWPFLTKVAKTTFNYTGSKKPVGEVFMTRAQWAYADRLVVKAKKSAVQKYESESESAPAKAARKPRGAKVTEGQALLRAAGATFDTNGKMSTSADAKPARKPRTPKAKPTNAADKLMAGAKAALLNDARNALKPAKATKAEKLAPIQATWSKDDDKALEGLLDDIANATARLAHLNNARKQNISITVYDKATKPKAARQTKK